MSWRRAWISARWYPPQLAGIVFRLFDLTLDEQKLILSRVGPGRPLPPRRGRKQKTTKTRADRNLRLFDDL